MSLLLVILVLAAIALLLYTRRVHATTVTVQQPAVTQAPAVAESTTAIKPTTELPLIALQDVLLIVTPDQQVLYRSNMTADNPIGDDWVKTGYKAKDVGVNNVVASVPYYIGRDDLVYTLDTVAISAIMTKPEELTAKMLLATPYSALVGSQCLDYTPTLLIRPDGTVVSASADNLDYIIPPLLPGELKAVEAEHNFVLASNGTLWQLDENGQWSKLESNYSGKRIRMVDGRLWLLTSGGQLLVRTETGSWRLWTTDAQVTDFAVGTEAVYVLKGNNIFYKSMHSALEPWRQIPGQARRLNVLLASSYKQLFDEVNDEQPVDSDNDEQAEDNNDDVDDDAPATTKSRASTTTTAKKLRDKLAIPLQLIQAYRKFMR